MNSTETSFFQELYFLAEKTINAMRSSPLSYSSNGQQLNARYSLWLMFLPKYVLHFVRICHDFIVGILILCVRETNFQRRVSVLKIQVDWTVSEKENLVWFSLVLWHINHCGLFKAKSSL